MSRFWVFWIKNTIRIYRTQVGPSRRKKGRPPGFGEIINPPLPPLRPLLQQLKAPASPQVKRLRDGKISRGLPLTACSPPATPNRTGIPPSSECALVIWSPHEAALSALASAPAAPLSRMTSASPFFSAVATSETPSPDR